MGNAFKDITHMFQNGAILMLKMLLLYIILPEVVGIVGIIILGGILRIRGKMLSFLLTGVALMGFCFFAIHGFPNMTNVDFKN